jgi:hypothetical protein
MTKGILAVLTVSVLMGTLAGALAGPATGLGMFAGTAVVGSIAVVLWRNRRDRRELERKLLRVPVRRVVGDDPPMRRSG